MCLRNVTGLVVILVAVPVLPPAPSPFPPSAPSLVLYPHLAPPVVLLNVAHGAEQLLDDGHKIPVLKGRCISPEFF
jgi:hypothetical protein